MKCNKFTGTVITLFAFIFIIMTAFEVSTPGIDPEDEEIVRPATADLFSIVSALKTF